MAEKIYDDLFKLTQNAEEDFPEDKEKLNEVVTEGPDNKGLKNRPEKKDDDKLAEDDMVKEALDEEEFPEETPAEPGEQLRGGPEEEKGRSVFDRMEGLVDQGLLDTAQEAIVGLSHDLLKDGFEPSDIAEYLNGRFEATISALADNLEADRGIARATPGEEECIDRDRPV